MAKILVIEIDEASEENMVKSLMDGSYQNLSGRVIEAWKDKESYEKNKEEEK